MACENCGVSKAIILRPKNKKKVCKECFYELFENEIHELIVTTKMFERNSRVGIGISGGKDSTVLAYILDKLNKKYDYGLHLILLCVDEGISGYRDKSIDTVYENQRILGLELKIVSYQDIFGLTMDDVVKKIGKKGNCTYCGIFRRQSLEEAARRMNVDCIVTGHNADDLAETILLNFFRGDISRLKRCTLSRTKEQLIDDKAYEDKNDNKVPDKCCKNTGSNEADEDKNDNKVPDKCCMNNESDKEYEDNKIFDNCCKNNESNKISNKCCSNNLNNFKGKNKNDNFLESKFLSLSRCKPFKYSYQKEIVFYAYFKKLPYFSTECTYAPNASRGDFRTLIKDLEKEDSEIIFKLIKSGEYFLDDSPTYLTIKKCLNCDHPTSSTDQICNACGLLDKLKSIDFSGCCLNNK